jgi:putative membrane protein
MRRTYSTIVAATVLIALAGATAGAQTQNPPRHQPAAHDTAMKGDVSADAEFAKKAAMGGKKEVSSAKFAAGKATNAAVKQFANKLVTDHTKANQELLALMKTKRITAPAEPAKGDNESWRSQSGAAFDRAFIDHAIADHQNDIALFEEESKNGTDADLKAWATQKLPTLREHLKTAQDLKAKLTTSTNQD